MQFEHTAIRRSGGVGGGFAEQPPIGTEPLTPATANNSAAAIAITHR
ncbi:MAG: hypothetical protein WAZ77_15535 [Candidatus Nitrosopolaris sp.]